MLFLYGAITAPGRGSLTNSAFGVAMTTPFDAQATHMRLTARNQWIRPMLLVAIVYAVVGIVTADLARAAPSPQMRTVWRVAAWLLSLVAFGAQIAY